MVTYVTIIFLGNYLLRALHDYYTFIENTKCDVKCRESKLTLQPRAYDLAKCEPL